MLDELVALLAEGVDRNMGFLLSFQVADVALLAEGVDRNNKGLTRPEQTLVALLAEGVDRNCFTQLKATVL